MNTKWTDALTEKHREELNTLHSTNVIEYRLLRDRLYKNYKNKNLSPKSHADKLDYIRRWKLLNKDKVKASYHRTKHKHVSHIKERSRKYYLKNKAEMITKHIAYAKQRRLRDVAYRVETCLRSRFRSLLIGRRREFRTMETLGCSREEFKLYLESLWLPGMSWDNYGLHGWHIDHKRPCCTFDLLDESQVKQCFHYTNMQPLWAADNLHKQRRYFPVEPLAKTGA